MLFWPNERATILVPSGSPSDPDRKHLFILLCNPVTDERMVLMTSISTIREGRYYDPACIINPTETTHKFIKNPSYVYYKSTTIKQENNLSRSVIDGTMEPMGTIETGILERILSGLLESIHTPKKCKQFYLNHIQTDSGETGNIPETEKAHRSA